MSDLDEKLLKLLIGIQVSSVTHREYDDINEEMELEAASRESYLREIKQVFADAGYVHVPQVEMVTRYERGKEPELFMVNGKEVMTGQEWYNRFEKQYHMSADWISADEEMGADAEHDILNAAKLAAGLGDI